MSAVRRPADLPPGIRPVPMGEEHLEAVLRIERQSFASPWQPEHFRHELHRNPHALNVVVLVAVEVVGYACCWILHDELTINNIAVHPDWRRRGVGRYVLRHVLHSARERACRSASLEVRPSNRSAIRLYASEGFEEVGRRPNYYAIEGEDAIRMESHLASVAPGPDDGV